MTEGAPAKAEEKSDLAPACRVREATAEDVPGIAAAVAELLVELSGKAPSAKELEEATRELVENQVLGTVLMAETGEHGILGVLASSWQQAIHVPGRYGTIQDLWVHPDWRSRGVGGELLRRFFELAGELGIRRIEVGLPRDVFAEIEATESFYRDNGFERLGPRMRRQL